MSCDSPVPLDAETLVTAEALETMRFYLWILADRSLAKGVKQKVAPSDVVQQTIMEAHRDAARFQGTTRAELRAWLRSILIHNVRNTERSLFTEKRCISREEPGLSGETHARSRDRTPSSHAAFEEEFSLLELALSELPDDQRRAIELRSIRQLPFADVGIKLGRSSEAARKLWFRAVQSLQAAMAKLK